nr:hypothetical protein [Tanacetum cinerariifolium]
MPTEPSGHAVSPSLDEELALTDSESEYDKGVSEINDGDHDEGQAGPNPGEQNEGQAESNPVPPMTTPVIDFTVSQPVFATVLAPRPTSTSTTSTVMTATTLPSPPPQP